MLPRRLALALFLPLSCLYTPVFAQQLLYEIQGQGIHLTPIGDLDQDGSTDFLAGLLRAYSGRTGQELFGFDLQPYLDLNTSVELAANVGDVDGDTIPDLVIGAALYSGIELLAAEPVHPTTLPTPLVVFAPPSANIGVLGGVVPLGDLDGDGSTEILFGWPDVQVARCLGGVVVVIHGQSGGAVRICSSVNGSVFQERVEAGAGQAFGGVVARLGDLDGDGRADYAVATRQVSEHPFFCQLPGGDFVRVCSSASGAVLWQHAGTPRTVVSIRDLNRDGVDDVAFGFPFEGRVEVLSGIDGSLLRSLNDPLGADLNLFGNGLAVSADLFGSGSPSLLVAEPQPTVFPIGTTGQPHSPGPGAVLIYSLARHSMAFELSGRSTGDEYGADLAVLGDVNGDGRVEIAIGSSGAAPLGSIQVLSLDLYPQASGASRIPGGAHGIH